MFTLAYLYLKWNSSAKCEYYLKIFHCGFSVTLSKKNKSEIMLFFLNFRLRIKVWISTVDTAVKARKKENYLIATGGVHVKTCGFK